MAKKCLACDQVYAVELKLCPACGKGENFLVADRDTPHREAVDGVTLCGFLLLFNGVVTLALPKPQIGMVSIVLGLLLLMRIEKALPWVKALQFVKLIAITIMFFMTPHGILLVALLEPLLVLGLLSSQERIVRLCVITFGVLILFGIVVAILPFVASN